MIDKVRPSFLKVSQDFGTGFETDPTKRKIVSNLHSLASDFGCELILEGVEHPEAPIGEHQDVCTLTQEELLHVLFLAP